MPVPVLGGKVMEMNKMKLSSQGTYHLLRVTAGWLGLNSEQVHWEQSRFGLFGFLVVVEREDTERAVPLSPSGTPPFLIVLVSGKGIQVRNFNSRMYLAH